MTGHRGGTREYGTLGLATGEALTPVLTRQGPESAGP